MSLSILKQSRVTILLSVNAVVILLVGTLLAVSIWANGGLQLRVVSEYSDIVDDEFGEMELLESASNSSVDVDAGSSVGDNDYISPASHEYDNTDVGAGELWNENSITIYATPDIDVCVGGGLTELGDMYWQSSNQDVISGFYDSARTWLGYSADTCRYPVISGIGTTTITAGTYDGKRKDSIVVNVVEPPESQWEHEVLTLVNKIRVKNNLSALSWGDTCEEAADIRAKESMVLYSHTRPDGSSWSTACPTPASGGVSGENLAVGNAAISPSAVVALWMGSEHHRNNILNPEYTKLSVGFVFDMDSNYRTYWSQFFSTF